MVVLQVQEQINQAAPARRHTIWPTPCLGGALQISPSWGWVSLETDPSHLLLTSINHHCCA